MAPDDIRRFFHDYRDAFVRFDVDTVACSYHAPSIMARRDSYSLWATPDEVRANCDALLAFYRQRGAERAEFEIASFQEQGPHFALVTLDWRFYFQSGAPSSFHATYNLFEQAARWQILVATIFD
jgi:hypothetical protein